MREELRKTPGSGKEKAARLRKLQKYRKEQASLAIWRDNAQCVRCYFKFNSQVTYEHVHHAFGRGNYEVEHYNNLMCLCASCHDGYAVIRVPNKGIHAEQHRLLMEANGRPINSRFVPPEKTDV